MIINMPIGCTLPPRPVTGVTATIVNYEDGTNDFSASWTLGPVYDVQVGKIRIYGYAGEEMPTNFNEFELITELSNTSISAELNVDKVYYYILVAPTSTDDVVQKDFSQMCKTKAILNMPAKGTTFSEMSWEQINRVSTNGYAREYFSVNDTKTMNIDGTPYDVQIYGFDHDNLSDGSGKAGITIGLVNLLATTYAIHNDALNTGGWEKCAFRTTLQNTIYNQLPQEVRNGIKTVSKLSGMGKTSTLKETNDTLFLFSEVEITGTTSRSASGEGSQYSGFVDSTNRIKYIGGSKGTWLTRSALVDANGGYVGISTAGAETTITCTTKSGVCFGFCI